MFTVVETWRPNSFLTMYPMCISPEVSFAWHCKSTWARILVKNSFILFLIFNDILNKKLERLLRDWNSVSVVENHKSKAFSFLICLHAYINLFQEKLFSVRFAYVGEKVTMQLSSILWSLLFHSIVSFFQVWNWSFLEVKRPGDREVLKKSLLFSSLSTPKNK